MTALIPPERFAKFREYLAGRGYTFEDRPHQVFMAKAHQTVVNLYTNGKIVMGGAAPEEQNKILRFLEGLTGELQATVAARTGEPQVLDFHETRVGMDEAGKGDYFGPLVACGVIATEYQADRMRKRGVRDSKELKEAAIREIAEWIRKEVLERGQWRTVTVPPDRYNILIHRMGNLNRVLGWAHARALEDVLKFNEPCSLAIADQFGDPKYIENALMANGRRVRLVQTPKGERDVVVAAASILARDEFVSAMQAMNRRFGETFPLGASHVEVFARDLVLRKGPEILLDAAKFHFATTKRVVESKEVLEQMLAEREAKDRTRNGGQSKHPTSGEQNGKL
jgi:ribonuclease HIII